MKSVAELTRAITVSGKLVKPSPKIVMTNDKYANGEPVIFNLETLEYDLQRTGYDREHIETILEAVANKDGAMRNLTDAEVL